MKSASARPHGFSLVELMVSLAISAFLVLAAVTLFADHTRLLSVTGDRVDMYQDARRAVELIARDLRGAGVGIGYRPDGAFGGLSRGRFTVAGGAEFESNDRAIDLGGGPVPTDDLGIRVAAGDIRTIADFDATSGQICAGGRFEIGDVVVLGSREGLYARTARLSGLAPAACHRGECLGGCVTFSWEPLEEYLSGPSAAGASYAEGQMYGEFQHLVWFVHPTGDGRAELKRAAITPNDPCDARSTGCGGTMARNVEALQVAVWQWDSIARAWVDRTGEPEIVGSESMRVDVEMVVRSDDDYETANADLIHLELAPGNCVPSGCREDGVVRWVVRTSVEIRNAGRLQIL